MSRKSYFGRLYDIEFMALNKNLDKCAYYAAF
jgi:hypothetical protein